MARSIKRLSLNKVQKSDNLSIPDDGSFPYNRELLYEMGRQLITDFCTLNKVELPNITLYKDGWPFNEVASFFHANNDLNKSWNRPTFPPGICIYLGKCQQPCTNLGYRMWSWPGSNLDKTPYGLLAHELGHYFDWMIGNKKGKWWSEYSIEVYKESRESKLNKHRDNPAEWFAEMFRLYVTNPNLLLNLKPKTYVIINRKWQHLPLGYWKDVLGKNVPDKIINNLLKLGARYR